MCFLFYRNAFRKRGHDTIVIRRGEAMLKGLRVGRNGDQFLKRPSGIVIENISIGYFSCLSKTLKKLLEIIKLAKLTQGHWRSLFMTYLKRKNAKKMIK